MFYRLSRASKHAIIDFLRRIFFLYERGDLPFSDGDNAIIFSRRPDVRIFESWECEQSDPTRPIMLKNRYYPCVLVSDASGPLKTLSFTTTLPPQYVTPEAGEIRSVIAAHPMGDFVQIDDSLDPNEVVVGGSAEITVSMSCVARSRPEADNLADITTLFLAHPLLKSYLFSRHYIEVRDAPRLGGQTSVEDVATDFKMYQSDISVDIRGGWEDRIAKLDKLQKAILTLDLVDP